MATKDRVKATGRREKGRYAGIPIAVLETEKYVALSPWARVLLLEIQRQYSGFNNGDISVPWSLMAKRGFKSKGTLNSALRELLEAGFIICTRQGGRHRCSLYGNTWDAIDEVIDKRSKRPKLDHPATVTGLGLWKD